MKKDNNIYLNDILHSIEKIEEYIEGMSEDNFYDDDKTIDAVTRNYEIIGEAVKRLDTDFRKLHPQIEWKKLAGMRDVLIHNYSEVDLQKLWQACKISLPILKKKIIELLNEQ